MTPSTLIDDLVKKPRALKPEELNLLLRNGEFRHINLALLLSPHPQIRKRWDEMAEAERVK